MTNGGHSSSFGMKLEIYFLVSIGSCGAACPFWAFLSFSTMLPPICVVYLSEVPREDDGDTRNS